MLDKVLFTIKGFEVTITIVILIALVSVLLVGIIAFRRNYILQVKLSQLMDAESGIYNAQGMNVLLRKKRKKILKNSRQVSPTILIISMENLGNLYVGYKNKAKLMKTIAKVFCENRKKYEYIARMDFNKIGLVVTDCNREEVKDFFIDLNQRLDELDIENYGLYSFFLTCAVYEGAKLSNVKKDIELASATLLYSTVRDNNIYYYSEDVYNKVKQLETINSLKDSSFANGQFVPYIQPKVDFRTGKVIGGELLVRWVDTNQNIMYRPDEFVPLFESNGFIRNIDMKMFEDCCSLLQTLKASGHEDVHLSTNFSRLTLNSLKSTEHLIEIVKKYDIDPSQIEIEITETEYMESANSFANSLMKIRQAGFRVSMDDFGKEYSSLSLLIDNRFDTIKVDKFFFQNGLSTDKEKNVVQNLINLLSKVGCQIVLEGIETVQVLDFLATFNRNVVLQGYYFSKPIPPSKFEAFLDTVYTFDYPEINEKSTVVINETPIALEAPEVTTTQIPGGATINVTTTVPNSDKSNEAVEALKRQIEELNRKLDQQKSETHKADMDFMNQQMEMLRKQQEQALAAQKAAFEAAQAAQNARQTPVYEPQIVYRNNQNDDEISRLRREIDDLKYQRDRDRDDRYYRDRYDRRYDERDREYEELHRQIRELKEEQRKPQQNIDVADLIERLSKTQQANIDSALKSANREAQDLRDRLEREKKEREELEALVNELQNPKEEEEETLIAQEEIDKAQEEADKNLNLDIDSLSESDEATDDEEEDSEEEEEQEAPLAKPGLTLEEIEAIIKSYQDKYRDEWNKHAQDELKDGYYEVINGLKYYKGKKKKTFIDKIKKASPEVKQLFNIVKNEIMKYSNLTNRLTNSYDVFYMGRKTIAKVSMTKARVKVFLALDPQTYTGNLPHKDVSNKKAHQRTPFYTMVKSKLSVKRLKQAIASMMESLNLKENENYKPIDYATKYKFFKSDQKK